MSEPKAPAPVENPRERRFRVRLGRHLLVGCGIGAIIGISLGAIVGLIWFDRDGAIWAAALAGGVFCTAVGALMAGYSSLESPDPGQEPSDTQRPIKDRPEAVREEHERTAER